MRPLRPGVRHKTMKPIFHLSISVFSFLLLCINIPKVLSINSPLILDVNTNEGQKIFQEISDISGLAGEEKTLDSSQAMELDLFVKKNSSSEKRARVTITLIAFFGLFFSLSSLIRGHLNKKLKND